MGSVPEFHLSLVSYNTAHCIGPAIESILSQEGVSLQITVVDNASTDPSREEIARHGVTLIANERNVGFGTAHNQALLTPPAQFVGIINPDLQLPPGLLKAVAAYFAAHPDVGLVAPGVVSGDERPDPPSLRYPGEKKPGVRFPGLPGEIAWVIGACLFMRHDLFKQLGGFDEDFFLYSEETDLCLRIRKAGYRIAHLPEWRVPHLGGQSERKSSPYDVAYRKHVSLLLFYRKHYGNAARRRVIWRDTVKACFRMAMMRLAALFSGAPHPAPRYEQYRALLAAIRTDGARHS